MIEYMRSIAKKFLEMRQLYGEYILWIADNTGNDLFICNPDDSRCWWVWIGAVEEIAALTIVQLHERIMYAYHTTPLLWFPPSALSNGISRQMIEAYYAKKPYTERELQKWSR